MIHLALVSLHPKAKWRMTEDTYESIEWLDEQISKPTKEQVENEIVRLQEEYKNNKYQRDRAEAYPSIVDQLDTLYHGGYDAWKATIEAVKNQYPKP